MGKKRAMDKCKPLNFGAGLGIGLGAGIFIGMLLAPKSGRETRQVIRTSAVGGEEYLEQRGAALRDALKDLIHAVSRQRDNLMAAIEAGEPAYRKAGGEAATVTPSAQTAVPEPET
jgi:gas vesicle protein